jgi:hypothetical protein
MKVALQVLLLMVWEVWVFLLRLFGVSWFEIVSLKWMLLYENWKPLLLIVKSGSSSVQNVKNIW